MKKQSNHLILSSETIKDIFGESGFGMCENFIGDEITLVTNSSLIDKNMPKKKLIRTLNPQIAFVTKGEASFFINYDIYTLKKGTLLLLPIGTVFSINSQSDDWNIQILDFHIPETETPSFFFFQMDIIELSHSDSQLVSKYMELIQLCKNNQTMLYSIKCIVQALIYSINVISNNASRNKSHAITRTQQLCFQFLSELLKTRDNIIQRGTSYYAVKLQTSENNLSNCVRKTSGNSVLGWINRVCLDSAKSMLAENELSVSEISYKVGFQDQSSFSRFFKRETGLTPAEYRKQKGKEE